ncbi:hypothetical protein [Persephonella sp.]
MFYTYFLFQLFLIVLLSPIRWTINLIVRQLWEPFEFNRKVFKEDPKEYLKPYADKLKEKLIGNIDKITRAGDSAKFISILLVATNNEKVKNAFKSYVKDGKFYRKPGQITKKAFSGDMFAGYSYALLHLFYRREFESDLYFKKEIIEALDNSIFQKPYLQLKSYSKTADRGYLLRCFFMNAGHFLPVLVSLQLLYKLTEKRKYKVYYYLIFPIAAIDILINPTFAIRYKNYRYMQWYYVHSNFLYYYTLYKLTSNPIYMYALKFIYNRFWFNPEFAALMEKDPDTPLLYMTDYTHQSKEENQKAERILTKRKVKNLKNILRRKPAEYEEYTQILPPRARKNDYQWEKAMDWNEWKETELSGIDFLHIFYLGEKYIWVF